MKGEHKMISTKLQDAINNQIQAELNSAYIYLAMSVECEQKNLSGFASWLRVQYQEENSHAFKLVDYLLERGGSVKLQAIEAPATEYGTPVELFEKVLAHEIHITNLINKLYEVALEEKDYAAQIFLQWFIAEQVEEEASASAVLERLKFVGDKGGSLLYIDKELGKRG
ncbi:MAG: Ferroxidase [Pelosinus sp.]|jgi:ferritin|nr:Ferroxidase [Pelosinus sp.]